jgi:hypothetical protein
MKVTKQELQKIIKEELDAMAATGELEEGFLDKLLGKQPRFGDFVTDDDVKKKLDVVQKNLGDLRGLASNQGNKELGLQVTKISNDVAGLYSKTTPKGAGSPESSAEFGKTLVNPPVGGMRRRGAAAE